jgi:hypothetical protein
MGEAVLMGLKSSRLGPKAIATGALFDVDAISAAMGYDPDSPIPPEAWPDFSGGIETEFCCARCGYEWRGNPKPGAEDKAAVSDA